MAPPPRPVPTDYAQRRAALDNHDFPHERHWLDFKRPIYPTVPVLRRHPMSPTWGHAVSQPTWAITRMSSMSGYRPLASRLRIATLLS